jgi:hypothetical protein
MSRVTIKEMPSKRRGSISKRDDQQNEQATKNNPK